MLDAKRLLDSLMQAEMTDSAGQRVQSALGPQGLGGQQGGGGLLEQLGQMLGGAGGAAGGQGGGGLGGLMGQLTGGGAQGGGLGGILGQVMGGLQQSAGRAGEAVKSNDPLAVGGLGAVVGALLGGRGGAVGGGALALLGSLAYAALQGAGQGAGGAQAAAPSRAALEQLTSEDTALLLVRAMVTAAKADGEIDQGEIDRIAGKLAEIGADEETRRWVMDEMRRPADLAGLVGQVPGPEVGAQVYAASLLAVEVDTEAERAYLVELARRLGLAPPVVAHIHRSLGLA